MKSVAEIRAARLRSQLDARNAPPVEEGTDEHCCGKCADESKKQGKKVCCATDKPKEESTFAQRVASALTDPIEEGKDKPVSKGPGGEHHTHAFVQRCVASITSKSPGMPTDQAFAICQVSKKKNPGAAKQKAKEGVPAGRVAGYEAALAKGRKERG